MMWQTKKKMMKIKKSIVQNRVRVSNKTQIESAKISKKIQKKTCVHYNKWVCAMREFYSFFYPLIHIWMIIIIANRKKIDPTKEKIIWLLWVVSFSLSGLNTYIIFQKKGPHKHTRDKIINQSTIFQVMSCSIQ